MYLTRGVPYEPYNPPTLIVALTNMVLLNLLSTFPSSFVNLVKRTGAHDSRQQLIGRFETVNTEFPLFLANFVF